MILHSLLPVLLSLACLAAAAPAAAEDLQTLRARRDRATEPLLRERLTESLAQRTGDALEAFDIWLDLALGAEDGDRRQRAARRVAVLALMLGQEGTLRRLPTTLDSPELTFARGVRGDGRPVPPLAELDPQSQSIVKDWCHDPRGCPMPDGPACAGQP